MRFIRADVKYFKNTSAGFTLVELAIVIVIIGLVVGGVVGGQSLIRSSENLSIINDLQKIETSSRAFFLEYGKLPGDFDEATIYWPSADTLDGNGDGFIKQDLYEYHHFFEHLSLAEIWPGFDFDHSASHAGFILGESYPEAPIAKAGYWVKGTEAPYYGRRDKNWVFLSAPFTFSGNVAYSVFTPKRARQLDNKIDDGHASKGRMLSSTGLERSPNPECTDGTLFAEHRKHSYGEVDYNLNSNEISCRSFFNILDNLK